MKALVYTNVRTLSYEEFQEPTAQFCEALVRVESVGICGSDMHAYLGHDNRRPVPPILGLEAAGTIIGGPRSASPAATVAPIRLPATSLRPCGRGCSSVKCGRLLDEHQRPIVGQPLTTEELAEWVGNPLGLLNFPRRRAISLASRE